MASASGNAHAFARRSASRRTDARERPLREKGAIAYVTVNRPEGAQRPEHADLEGPADAPSRTRATTPRCAASS